jgi:hypothetical protein
VAVLLNQTSNLRLRLELTGRISDGVDSPASLSFAAALERYRHIAAGERGEHRFVPMLSFSAALLDMDLMTFLEQLEALLAQAAQGPSEGAPLPTAALEASVQPSLGVRVALAAPELCLVEVGIDLVALLEPVGGARSDPGADLALFRFPATGRGAAAFCAGLIEELSRFPTDPSRINPGPRE